MEIHWSTCSQNIWDKVDTLMKLHENPSAIKFENIPLGWWIGSPSNSLRSHVCSLNGTRKHCSLCFTKFMGFGFSQHYFKCMNVRFWTFGPLFSTITGIQTLQHITAPAVVRLKGWVCLKTCLRLSEKYQNVVSHSDCRDEAQMALKAWGATAKKRKLTEQKTEHVLFPMYYIYTSVECCVNLGVFPH